MVAINSITEQENVPKTQKSRNTQNITKVCHCDRQTIVCKPSRKSSNARNFKKGIHNICNELLVKTYTY